MNHSYLSKFFKHSLSSFFIELLIIVIIIISYLQKGVYALETDKIIPKVCIGVGAAFGYYNVNHTHGEQMQWEPDYGLGGGFVLERMLTDSFGLHSCIWFSQFTLKVKFPEDGPSAEGTMVEHKVKSDIITIPFYLITSFSSRIIALNLLTGFNFAYIIKSYMKPGSQGQNSEDIQKYLGYNQLGAGAGFELLFRITRFTRFFIGCIGEYYFTNLITGGDDTIDYLYDMNIRSGIMLCTF